MNTTAWIVMGAAAALMLLYLLVMRVFFRASREIDREIDYGKMRKWTDEDGKE